MKQTKNTILQNISRGALQGLWFLGVLSLAWITYASLSTVSSWDSLTAAAWNTLVWVVNQNTTDISTNSTGISTNSGNIALVESSIDTLTDNGSYKQKIYIWSAVQTSNVTANNETWVDVPWATHTFSLANSKTVKMRAYGSITPTWNVSWNSHTHCWVRFVLDWTWLGSSNWWDQILWCANSWKTVWRRCPWTIERDVNLTAGTHTIKVQLQAWNATSPWCTLSAAEYSQAKLFLEAW